MYATHFAVASLLARFAGAQKAVPGAPQYLGSTWLGIEPWPPRVGGVHDDDGFLEALQKPNLTGTYDFATPNISAPATTSGQATEESNSALQGWSLSVALTAGVPHRDKHYVAGELVLHTPASLLTNITDAGSNQKNVSVAEEWALCIISWDLLSEPYPPALRNGGDDGTCSSVLSRDCRRAVQAAARRDCADPQLDTIPECANDDTRAFRTSSTTAWYPARAMRQFPRGRAELMAFSTEPAPGGAGNLTSYNDMGTVAWPTLLTLRAGNGVARWSELFCVRPNKAVNGSTLPVWEKKDEEEGGGESGKEGEGEGQGDEEGAARNIAIDRVSMFGLGAVALAYLML
ncbi:hypothetical protein PG985_016171 [Apiospora marii]|uniref:uncharacterized protein n=1 Tax=Apiospora marii TaxID=335849 RepID=UPI00312D5FF6